MLKKENIRLIIVSSLVLVLALYYVSIRWYSIAGNKIVSVNIGKHKIYSEVVSSSEKMSRGLGGRSGMCSSCGMLFEFERSGKYSFWMKDMQFPLDLVWIFQKKIVHIEKNIQPSFSGVLDSAEKADAVLEVNAGTIVRLGIEMGDGVTF
jgi:hypothetical protein